MNNLDNNIMFYSSRKEDYLFKLKCLEDVYFFVLNSIPNNFKVFVDKQKKIFSDYVNDDISLKNYNNFSKKSYKNKHFMHFIVSFEDKTISKMLVDKYAIDDKDFLNNIDRLIRPGISCSEILNRIEGMYSVYVDFIIRYNKELDKLNKYKVK